MRRGITAAPMVVVFLLGSLLSSLAAAQGQTAGQAHVLRVNWGPEMPETLDPQHSDLGQWSMSGGLDYEGLTRIDEELQPIPGAAESWDFSPDGKMALSGSDHEIGPLLAKELEQRVAEELLVFRDDAGHRSIHCRLLSLLPLER